MKDAQPAFRGSEPLHQGKPRLIHYAETTIKECNVWSLRVRLSTIKDWTLASQRVSQALRRMFDRHKFGNWHLNKKIRVAGWGGKWAQTFQDIPNMFSFSMF